MTNRIAIAALMIWTAPGVMTWADAWVGPALFVPAWLFATIARRSTPSLDASPESLRPASA